MAILWQVSTSEIPLMMKRLKESEMVPNPHEMLPDVKAARLMFVGIVLGVSLLTAWLGFLIWAVAR